MVSIKMTTGRNKIARSVFLTRTRFVIPQKNKVRAWLALAATQQVNNYSRWECDGGKKWRGWSYSFITVAWRTAGWSWVIIVFSATKRVAREDARDVRDRKPGHSDKLAELGRDELRSVITITDRAQVAYTHASTMQMFCFERKSATRKIETILFLYFYSLNIDIANVEGIENFTDIWLFI